MDRPVHNPPQPGAAPPPVDWAQYKPSDAEMAAVGECRQSMSRWLFAGTLGGFLAGRAIFRGNARLPRYVQRLGILGNILAGGYLGFQQAIVGCRQQFYAIPGSAIGQELAKSDPHAKLAPVDNTDSDHADRHDIDVDTHGRDDTDRSLAIAQHPPPPPQGQPREETPPSFEPPQFDSPNPITSMLSHTGAGAAEDDPPPGEAEGRLRPRERRRLERERRRRERAEERRNMGGTEETTFQ